MIKVYSSTRDEVIRSTVATAQTDYAYALKAIFPLLNKFDEQRKVQSKKFYERLRKDIVSGCVMPPITLAFVMPVVAKAQSINEISKFINASISDGYVLDGLQRLTTLQDASSDDGFDKSRPLHINIIIAEKYDLLLYRMITLNNGQKPMTARHQVEMLTGPLLGQLELDKLSIAIVSEKETESKRVHGAFRKSDVIEAYTSYLTNSVHNQNSKIIEKRLDEIIVGRVMEAELTDDAYSFEEILREVARLSGNTEAKKWLRQGNNLVGFTVGAKTSLGGVRKMSLEKFSERLTVFEDAFEAINPSKVNVGKFRRELSAFFIKNAEAFEDFDTDQVLDEFHEKTLTE